MSYDIFDFITSVKVLLYFNGMPESPYNRDIFRRSISCDDGCIFSNEIFIENNLRLRISTLEMEPEKVSVSPCFILLDEIEPENPLIVSPELGVVLNKIIKNNMPIIKLELNIFVVIN